MPAYLASRRCNSSEGYRKEGYPPPGYLPSGYPPPEYPHSKAILHRRTPSRAIFHPTLLNTLRLRLSIKKNSQGFGFLEGCLAALSDAAAHWMLTSEIIFALHKLNSTSFNSIKFVSLNRWSEFHRCKVIRRRATERKDIHRLDTRLPDIPTVRVSSTALPCPGLSFTLRSSICSTFASASTKFTELWLCGRLVRLSIFLSNFDRLLRSDLLAALSAAAAHWMPTSEMTFALYKLDSTTFNSIKFVSLTLFPLLYGKGKRERDTNLIELNAAKSRFCKALLSQKQASNRRQPQRTTKLTSEKPLGKSMTTQKKQEKINDTEMEKRQPHQHNVVAKQSVVAGQAHSLCTR
ncbi:hypothetical protein VNO80_25091 [Phaseolus coccineus]|uniref:Uncharacterized protein n=1 Tax=Phaseolus coccineus TaxID=3886 RepID=A0AAN9LXX8_PHACN